MKAYPSDSYTLNTIFDDYSNIIINNLQEVCSFAGTLARFMARELPVPHLCCCAFKRQKPKFLNHPKQRLVSESSQWKCVSLIFLPNTHSVRNLAEQLFPFIAVRCSKMIIMCQSGLNHNLDSLHFNHASHHHVSWNWQESIK